MQVRKVWREAPRDVKLLWWAVFLRMLAYGMTNQILTLFFSEIGISDDEMGWFMSLTLVGDVCISYVLTWYADSWGRRLVLTYGSAMMALSGIVFATSENIKVLLAFAIIGVISPSSDEVGPFKSIEESMIAHLTPHNKRPEVYSMHSILGTLGSALGFLICGIVTDLLITFKVFQTKRACYKAIFGIYAVLAAAKVIISISLSSESEKDGDFDTDRIISGSSAQGDSDTVPEEDTEVVAEDTPLIVKSIKKKPLSKKTLSLVFRLLLIFMTDSLGAGFMTSSWMVYYYKKVFDMSNTSLGFLFFSSKYVMAASAIPSAIVARLYGPVRATLLVQIPSGIFSILIPFAESHLSLSIILLLLFFFTMAMDVTPRQIILTNTIPSKDLTKVMGMVNIGKTVARCIGPVFTGKLASEGYLWVCYVISGSLVILADMFLALLFCDIDEQILAKTNS
ncbi:uncharacterized protein KLLA0_D10615g [Kluyveromyces lactis]|uniref:KLLA0D10615p n=1 Tax=Kluyveromyces lactis (strain ATCC 8585 / CBS 2359 / DSM 70799 / NBRC 1267 / NRRL Y-1140 / WM37) TaxID=284590 RepID=Q6CRA5_KLULA|nr:uncharacterized protein KLLA0_D10615g [Kluyveromyces lactis]CAH00630.1 KLLA0D10615p [Kluyveromyces lactis]|eukprot:XP_453534.1 uncharacterized protein KLLA0_D10615g [Kluyveromyces lactis]